MNANEVRDMLRSGTAVADNEFSILQSIAALANDTAHANEARELVLRALEQRQRFVTASGALAALTRAVGLFPYLDAEDLDLRDSIAYEYHRPLAMDSGFVFHREQADVYHRLLAGENVILSAPTSFGKSRIIDAMIATQQFDNIAVIVPTLALIDETRKRLSVFSDRYKIVTHLGQKPASRNIFVLTPERTTAYDDFPPIEFFAVDEFYKIDALQEDDSRTVALNVAFQKLLRMHGQFYMLGPNIDRIPPGMEEHYRCQFYPTSFSTVVAEQIRVSVGPDEVETLTDLCTDLWEPTLVFCRSPARVNAVAQALLDADVGTRSSQLDDASRWAEREYHEDWIWGRALHQGIGIHHGRLPRSLAQYTVRKFNELQLRFLICTSTLIEGVNTKAKNVVVFDNKIAMRKINFFTFNNIKGRSGRMFEHFIGNVYLFADPPVEDLPFVDFPVFTQGESAPNSLLVQLEEDEVMPSAQARAQVWTEQEVLPIAILRANAMIDPDAQISLAEALAEDPQGQEQMLSWSRWPSAEQLKYACQLIWDHLAGTKRHSSGVFSALQLAYKIQNLQHVPSVADRIQAELNNEHERSPQTPDAAVEAVLQFDRNWASFEFPKLLMALSRVQEHVLDEAGLQAGDYSFFASQVECLFLAPVIAALDEYGIPIQLGRRLGGVLGTDDDLDLALSNLKRVDPASVTDDSFEAELLEEAQGAI